MNPIHRAYRHCIKSLRALAIFVLRGSVRTPLFGTQCQSVVAASPSALYHCTTAVHKCEVIDGGVPEFEVLEHRWIHEPITDNCT